MGLMRPSRPTARREAIYVERGSEGVAARFAGLLRPPCALTLALRRAVRLGSKDAEIIPDEIAAHQVLRVDTLLAGDAITARPGALEAGVAVAVGVGGTGALALP
jgi:hypothetical protein